MFDAAEKDPIFNLSLYSGSETWFSKSFKSMYPSGLSCMVTTSAIASRHVMSLE